MVTNANLSKQNLNVSKEFISQMDENRETDGTQRISQISSKFTHMSWRSRMLGS